MSVARRIGTITLAAGLLLAAGSASAVTITLLGSSVQGAGNTAHQYAADYDGTTPSDAAWYSDYLDVNPLVTPPPGNLSGIYQSPFNNTPLGDTQSYFSVGAVDQVGDGAYSPIFLRFRAPQTTFSLLWGSIDSYNTLSFFSGDSSTPVYSVTGTDVVNTFNLGGSARNFERVALLGFDFGEVTFDRIGFYSTQAAFEFALKREVPEPATLALLGLGLAGLGFAVPRRSK